MHVGSRTLEIAPTGISQLLSVCFNRRAASADAGRPCVSQGSRHFKLLAPGRGGRTRQACWEYVGGSVVGTGRLCVTSEHRVQLKKDT